MLLPRTERIESRQCYFKYNAKIFWSKIEYDFYIFPYEKLMIEQEKELKKIFHKINEEIPEKAYSLLGKKSMLGLDFIKEKRKQLSKWKKNLSRNQINKILKITELFNLDFYTDDVEMDYNKFMNWKNPIKKLHEDQKQ